MPLKHNKIIDDKVVFKLRKNFPREVEYFPGGVCNENEHRTKKRKGINSLLASYHSGQLHCYHSFSHFYNAVSTV